MSPPPAWAIPVIAVAIAFAAWCLVDLARAGQVRYLPKWVWAVVICVWVPGGGLVYLIVGKARPTASMRSKAPVAEEAGIAVSGPLFARRVPASPVAIEVDQLTKRFGPVTAVDALSFTVRPGHVTGFLGPNGAGKTTTMRVILGLDAPTSGGALVGGRRYQQTIRPLHVVGSLLDAAIGASAAREIVTLMTTTDGLRLLVPAVIFGAFAGAALAVAMWRNQLLEPCTGAVHGWAAGSGLGLGLAAGSIIALPQAFGRLPLAPDQLNPAAVGVLTVWIGLAILVFMPFPAWLRHWADAWQQPAGMTAPRVAARGGMVAAAVAAWAVMAVGLYLVLLSMIGILGGSSAASVWHQLPELLRSMGSLITAPGGGQLGGTVVCLVIVGFPLAAAVAHRRWRRSGDARDAALPGWRPVAIALLCLAGCLAAVALMLAISAVTHARIAEPVRWSPDFLGRLVFFEEQAIVVVAVVCALIAAATARSARTVALSVVVGAVVAAVGAVALPTAGEIGHCFGSLSIQYAHPPSGACITGPDSAFVRPTVLGAALAGVLFVPAAYAAGMLADRRIRRVRLAVGACALGWLAAGVVVIAAVMGTALWGPVASAQK